MLSDAFPRCIGKAYGDGGMRPVEPAGVVNSIRGANHRAEG